MPVCDHTYQPIAGKTVYSQAITHLASTTNITQTTKISRAAGVISTTNIMLITEFTKIKYNVDFQYRLNN